MEHAAVRIGLDADHPGLAADDLGPARLRNLAELLGQLVRPLGVTGRQVGRLADVFRGVAGTQDTEIFGEAEEEILANVNKMAEGYSYFQVGGMSVSPDNRYLAIGIDTVSRRKYTIYIKDLETGKMLNDQVPVTTGGASWANDSKTLFYTQKDEETLRSKAIFRHTLGTASLEDVLIFEEKDETFSTYVFKSKSNKYMIIGSASTLTNEYRYLSADNPLDDFKVVQARTRGLEYNVAHYGDHFYIITNLDATAPC